MAKVKSMGAAQEKQIQSVIVTVDMSDEKILAFAQDDGIELDWDYRSFRSLPDSVTGNFSMETLKRYWKAEVLSNQNREKQKQRVEVVNPLGNTTDMYVHRLQIRERRGFHQYWAKPGADYDRCISSGMYRVVRKPTDKQIEEGYEPGEENGEVLEIMNEDHKVELIAMECQQSAYEDYLKWMEVKSSEKYDGIKENYAIGIENVNRGITARGARIQALDEQGREI